MKLINGKEISASVKAKAAAAQHAAPGIGHLNRLAGREGRERRALHIHFVAENPEVAHTEAAVFAFFKEDGFHRQDRIC